MIVELPSGAMHSFADSKTKPEEGLKSSDSPPAYSDDVDSLNGRRFLRTTLPPLPPRHGSSSTLSTQAEYSPRSQRPPPPPHLDPKIRQPSPRATVDQVHIFEKKDDIKGTFFIDPTLPALNKTHRRKKGKSKHAPPHASFRSRRGNVTLDLATTGAVQQAPKANVTVSSLSGDININLLPMSPSSPRIGLDAFSRRGNVVLFLSQGFSGVVHLSTRKGKLDILPGLADVVKFVKRTDKEIIFMIDDHGNTINAGDKSQEASFCQLESRTGKLVVGLSGYDHYKPAKGFWKRLGGFMLGDSA